MKTVLSLMAAALVVAAAIAVQARAAVQQAPAPDAWRNFEGSLSASGQRQTLPTESGRPAATVQLSGPVAITAGEGLSRAFRSEAIGFDDGAGLTVLRGVWTDDRGDRIFTRLNGETVASGRRIAATITGGTGRYAGITASTASSGNTSWRPRPARSAAGPSACAGVTASAEAGSERGASGRGGHARSAGGGGAGRRDLARAAARGAHGAGMAPVRPLRRRDRLGDHRRASDPDRLGLRRGGRRADGHLTPAQAYAGFANSTILLIVMAFLVARAVVKCGLGQRLGHLVVSLFGRSTLGLSYSIFLVDGIIAPAFPSNTARGGVLYPLVVGLAEAGGATPGNAGRRKLGGYLMFSGMASLSLSSALWFTAMAANPLGAELARSFGVTMNFGTWLVAASVPTLAAMLLLPWVLQRIMSPEVTKTPDAPASAKRALAALGPFSRDERIVAITFVGMVGSGRRRGRSAWIRRPWPCWDSASCLPPAC